MGGRRRADLSDEEIRRLYWDETKTPAEIGVILGVSPNTVISRMRRAQIPRRTKIEGTRLSARWPGRKWGPPTAEELKVVLRCRGCGWAWERDDSRIFSACPKCERPTDARKRRGPRNLAVLIAWKAKHPGQSTESSRRARRTALLLVGRGTLACVLCGCDRAELLEINHINGAGTAEIRSLGSSSKFYREIGALRRSVHDLELRCKVCNALHALELQHGPLPYEIRYRREAPPDDRTDSSR